MLETTQPEVEMTANQPDSAAVETEGKEAIEPGMDEPFLTVRYNKADTPLTKEAATTYAQKGMNYDKLSERLEAATAKLTEYEDSELYRLAREYEQKSGASKAQMSEMLKRQMALGLDENAAMQAVVDKQLADFMRRNPGMDPRELPEDVLDAWRQGVPLSEAMVSHQAGTYRQEVQNLRQQLAQMQTNAQNAAASMGRPQSNGLAREKPLSEETIRNMSKAELDRNHERIWAFLTGTKREK